MADAKDLERTLEKQSDEEVVEIAPDGTLQPVNRTGSQGKRTVLHDPQGEY
jgi:hypothetical protein